MILNMILKSTPGQIMSRSWSITRIDRSAVQTGLLCIFYKNRCDGSYRAFNLASISFFHFLYVVKSMLRWGMSSSENLCITVMS